MERKRLTFEDRKKIEELYLKCWRVQDIADFLGKSIGTIYAELKRGRTNKLDENGRIEYKAEIGQTVYNANIRYRRKGKKCQRRSAK